MTQVLDYSFARPSPRVMRDAGFVGVMRYLSGGGNPKDLTVPERDALQAVGLEIGLVWETTATRMNGGYGAGAADALAANAQASGLGFPSDRPIRFANDQNRADPAHFDYMRGARENSRRPVSPYGSTALVDGCAAAGDRYGWKVSTWGPSTPNAVLIQEANVRSPIGGTDVNTVARADWGQWGGAPAPPPKPPPEVPEVKPFFVVDRNGSVWFCRDAGRGGVHSNAVITPLAWLSDASNAKDGHVFNEDHKADDVVDDILSQFAILN